MWTCVVRLRHICSKYPEQPGIRLCMVFSKGISPPGLIDPSPGIAFQWWICRPGYRAQENIVGVYIHVCLQLLLLRECARPKVTITPTTERATAMYAYRYHTLVTPIVVSSSSAHLSLWSCLFMFITCRLWLLSVEDIVSPQQQLLRWLPGVSVKWTIRSIKVSIHLLRRARHHKVDIISPVAHTNVSVSMRCHIPEQQIRCGFKAHWSGLICRLSYAKYHYAMQLQQVNFQQHVYICVCSSVLSGNVK